MPGGEVFQELYNLGVNIHWLLSGDGEIMRNAQPDINQFIDYNLEGFMQLRIVPDDEFEELLEMPSETFWKLFTTYGNTSPAQAGWSQAEVAKRFPEFRRWLKIKKKRDASREQLRKKTA